jgi:glycosyltransferase involved in cell wall biosynthesis
MEHPYMMIKTPKETEEDLSFILPACNEEEGLNSFLPLLRNRFPTSEIIVINDGSTDQTEAVAKNAGVEVISHLYQMGNGAALKTGARHARRSNLVFLDADGQHTVEQVEKIIQVFLSENADMVVGARSKSGQANGFRLLGNSIFNRVASMVVGHKVSDLTSGCRVVKSELYREFLHLLPNGFSAPTTITLAFFKSGYSIKYVSIDVKKRIGNSHLRVFKDGLRFSIILYKLATLYSPLKIFMPLALLHFLAAFSSWVYNYYYHEVLISTGSVFFTTGILILVMGLVSEQITIFLYQTSDRGSHNKN